MLNDVFHAVRASLCYFRSLIRVACVVAVAMAGILHVAADFRSVQADYPAVSAAQPDADRSAADATVEACHSCAVVAFFASGQNLEAAAIAGAIPSGRAVHLFAFQQAATAPPPRALT